MATASRKILDSLIMFLSELYIRTTEPCLKKQFYQWNEYKLLGKSYKYEQAIGIESTQVCLPKSLIIMHMIANVKESQRLINRSPARGRTSLPMSKNVNANSIVWGTSLA